MASIDGGGGEDERTSSTSSLAELSDIIGGGASCFRKKSGGIEDDYDDADEDGELEEGGCSGGSAGGDCGSDGDVGHDDICSQCNQKYVEPRVLSCLHVFCEQCLNRILIDNSDGGDFDGGPATLVGDMTFVACPECQQETKVSKHGASSLPPDYVRFAAGVSDTNAAVSESGTDGQSDIVCTSCKTKKNAVARCNDCATFLCLSCVSAHQYMRCFENHKVVEFKDMTVDPHTLFQKTVNCPSHSDEALKYFCLNCQFPVCDECLMTDHKGPSHHFEIMSNIEHKQREEMLNLMAESKSKVQFCEDATGTLEGLLSELQMQNDNAKSHIEETFQTYKAFLEKVKEQKLKELDNLHAAQELNVMDTYHNVETTREKIEDACKFTTGLLKDGDIAEILLLKSIVRSQLLYLINNTPKPDVNVCLEFETSEDKFENAVTESFGDFKKPGGLKDRVGQQPPSSLHSSFESDVFRMPAGVLGGPDVGSNGVNSNSASSSTVGLGTPTAFPDFTLSQLASIADMSHSPTSPLCLADIISSDSLVSSNINALNNLTALAKLGSATLNNQGQLLMNGQVVSGFGMDGGITSHPNSSSSPTTFDSAAFGALLNGGGLHSPHGMSSRGGSPHLDPNGLSSAMANSLLIGGNGEMINFSSSGLTSPRTSNAKLIPVRIRFKFGQLGPGKGQFSSPHGFCLGADEEIVVADTNNHRIQIFDKCGEFKNQFGIPGKEEGQLWYPRKVAVMRNSGKFVVCDRGNERSRMQIFSKTGHFIKKIAIRYIDIVAGLAITHQGHIVAVDSVSPTVFVISEGGDLLCWFDCSDYMREPSDIAISGKEYFVCDFKGHCVVVFNEEGQFLRRIGCENITNYPNGIDISDAGDVLVGDSHGNRFHVAVFSRDGSLLSEYECPYVKVSRCCGLKITTEGYIVTLAKNNHHVLILNMLYIM